MIAKKRYKTICLLPFIGIALSILACVGSQQLGTLSINENSTTFTLRGEVDHRWQINVISGEQYSVVVRKINSDHPLNQIRIEIQHAEDSTINFIGTPVSFSDTTVTTDFTAPGNGILTVIISSKIGENQENLGEFSVQLLDLSD